MSKYSFHFVFEFPKIFLNICGYWKRALQFSRRNFKRRRKWVSAVDFFFHFFRSGWTLFLTAADLRISYREPWKRFESPLIWDFSRQRFSQIEILCFCYSISVFRDFWFRPNRMVSVMSELSNGLCEYVG